MKNIIKINIINLVKIMSQFILTYLYFLAGWMFFDVIHKFETQKSTILKEINYIKNMENGQT